MDDSPATLNTWLRRHGPTALLFARQLTHNLADAEEATQEGFIRFWRDRTAARDPVAFLYTCVRSAAIDHRRAARRRETREHRAGEASAREGDTWFAAPLEDRERTTTIEAALQSLPEDQREVVILKMWADMTFDQIANALDVSPNTVASRYRYAIEKLALLLKRTEVMP